jgi:TolB-like protein
MPSIAGIFTDLQRRGVLRVPGYGGRKAIAVLPSINMSGDADQGYLADGITEDIITELYSYQTFPVIARTSTFRYKGQSMDVREIAADLGAGYVLEGSVRRIGERVRVSAQLIDANGEHLWAENYDRPWSEILNVHDEVTYSIVEAIEPELIRSETARSRHVGTEDLVAWDYYLQARALSAEEFSNTTLSGKQVTMETTEEAWRLSPRGISMPTYLSFEALIRQSMGDMVGARRVARQVKLLAGAWSATSMIEITSYLAEGERDKALQALDDWHRELPNANPADGFWPEPFPQAVIDHVEEPLRSRLQGKNLPEGIMIVMQDLGWTPPLAKS